MTTAAEYGNVIVLAVDSEFSGDTVSQFQRVAEEQLRPENQWFIVDCEKTTGMDSSALEALLWFRDEVEGLTGAVKICGLDETCAKIFELARFDRKFEVFESLTEAMKSYE
ncbi:MAG: STAS domain-containing protein [Anaerolineaceae bacterium]|nr:STAS domain-containing protein [Anaerolineaceae bacterium]